MLRLETDGAWLFFYQSFGVLYQNVYRFVSNHLAFDIKEFAVLYKKITEKALEKIVQIARTHPPF